MKAQPENPPLAQLEAELAKAQVEYEEAAAFASAAHLRQSEACNRLNDVQKRIDRKFEELRATAKAGDWKSNRCRRTNGVSIG